MIINPDNIDLSFDYSSCFNNEANRSNDLLYHSELDEAKGLMKNALSRLMEIKGGKVLDHGEKALFMDLPHQNNDTVSSIKKRADYIKSNFKYVISFGIGGSYLGNIALIQALNGLYYNISNKNPKIYFLGNNLDPESLQEVKNLIEIDKLHIILISKSGSTLEPLAGFSLFYNSIIDAGLDIRKHITFITGQTSSLLYQFGREKGIHTLLMPEHIGGRFSVLSSAGLLSSAIADIDIDLLLKGSRDSLPLYLREINNPALIHSCIGYLFYKKAKFINILMPYSDRLQYFGQWYIQLFSESLGKEGKGRTPMLAIGTTDMHSQTQQHQEGNKDKLITFLEIKNFESNTNIKEMPDPLNIFKGSFSEMIHIARKANEKALYIDNRPSCTITINKLNEHSLGAMIMFFEISTVLEGIMLEVNPFDQPGVEGYKKIMKQLMKE